MNLYRTIYNLTLESVTKPTFEIASTELPNVDIGGPILLKEEGKKEEPKRQYTWKTWFTLALVLLMLLALILELYKSWFTVFITLVILMVTGIVNVKDALSGFANDSVLTIGALFVVVGPLSRNPLMKVLVKYLFGKPQRFYFIPVLRIVVPIMILSAFLNNTPIVALFTPLIEQWCKDHGDYPSKYLIPLSFATCILLLIGFY